MSEQAGEAESPPEGYELPASLDAAFAGLMDVLAPEPDEAPAGEAGAADGAGAEDGAAGAAGADARGAGAAPEGGGPAAGTDASGAPAAGDQGAGGGGAADAAAAAGAGAAGSAVGVVDAAVVAPKLGELKTTFEETTYKAFQNQSLEAVKTEHPKYFEALEKHPRLLVGQKVPALDGSDRMETLKDASDAREWQDALKGLLVAEVRSRSDKQMEENQEYLATIHSSIELFQNNVDLIPGTKGFDTELANKFAELAKPYELRVEGKLQGYTIPVQPIIDQLRTQLTTARAAQTPPAGTAAPAATPSPGSAGGAPAAAAADPPQAGISSKAGSGDASGEDMSTFWGTLGLPNLQL